MYYTHGEKFNFNELDTLFNKIKIPNFFSYNN